MFKVLGVAALIALFAWRSDTFIDPSTFGFTLFVREKILAAKLYIFPTDNAQLVSVDNENLTIDYGTFDFIIVGAGSAGTLLAHRLTEIKGWKVLLLEAGGEETEFSDIPGMAGYLQWSDMNWGYFSSPQRTCCLGMKNHSCVATRGKVLGGSSTINAKMYVRGNKRDYDNWEKLGNKGWSYKHVLPYFIKTEKSTIYNGDAGYHGHKGLLQVQYNQPTIFTEAYMEAMTELGVDKVDYNGRQQLGASPIAFKLNGIKAASGGRVFIDPIRNRTNLNVTLNAFATNIWMNRNINKAKGVWFIKKGKKFLAKASREIILSAGAYNTPQILMLSGIGPKKQLEKHNINLLLDLPVGRGFQEHTMFLGLIIRTNQSLFKETLDTYIKDYKEGKRPLTNPMNLDSHRFLNVDNTTDIPDIQHLLVVPPGYLDDMGPMFNFNDEITKSINENYNMYTDLVLLVTLLHPKSTGRVMIKSQDPKDFPDIDYNFFSDPKGHDIDTMYKGIQEALKLLNTQAFRSLNATLVPIVRGCEDHEAFSKGYWYCAIRHMSSVIYHPLGSTKMGVSPEDSVVTPQLKVHGLKNLRVIDAGIMPSAPSGNLNAIVFMIAEKMADEIKNHHVNTLLVNCEIMRSCEEN